MITLEEEKESLEKLRSSSTKGREKNDCSLHLRVSRSLQIKLNRIAQEMDVSLSYLIRGLMGSGLKLLDEAAETFGGNYSELLMIEMPFKNEK